MEAERQQSKRSEPDNQYEYGEEEDQREYDYQQRMDEFQAMTEVNKEGVLFKNVTKIDVVVFILYILALVAILVG